MKDKQAVQRYRWVRVFIYRLIVPLLRVAVKLFFGLRAQGISRIPKEGGFIIASNHPTYLDPLFIGCACPRRVSFIAKRPIFFMPLLRSLLWLDECIPVSKGAGDIVALRECVRRLKGGDAIVIFPEGTRSDHGRMRPFTQGAVLIALLSGCPIIPCAIVNAYQAWQMDAPLPRPHWGVEVRFGEPIYVPQKLDGSKEEMLQEVTTNLMMKVKQLGAS
jgi:1-acyl-sn-glycerol-3-phosphate acyltransferase